MSSEVETTQRSSRELRCRIMGACHCKSGVKFATANPSSGPETIRGTPSAFANTTADEKRAIARDNSESLVS
jgi:hypothetical protein